MQNVIELCDYDRMPPLVRWAPQGSCAADIMIMSVAISMCHRYLGAVVDVIVKPKVELPKPNPRGEQKRGTTAENANLTQLKNL